MAIELPRQARENPAGNASDIFRQVRSVLERDADLNARIGVEECSRVQLAKSIYQARRRRDEHFPQDIFAEPAWDILLLLYWLRADQPAINITAVCVSAGVPPTTALRWVQRLIELGMIERSTHPTDQRVGLVTLSAQSIASLEAYFDTIKAIGFR